MNGPAYKETTYAAPTYSIPAGNSDTFGITYDYLLIESISDATLTELEVIVDGFKRVTLPIGVKLRFNQIQKTLTLINSTAAEIDVKVGFGIGDIEDYRLFGNLSTTPAVDYAPAYTDHVMASLAAGASDILRVEDSNLTPSGSSVKNAIDATSIQHRRLLFVEIVETSGTPGANIQLIGNSIQWSGNGIVSCYSGQRLVIDNPKYLNGDNMNRIYALYENGATGYVKVMVEDVAADGSGARA